MLVPWIPHLYLQFGGQTTALITNYLDTVGGTYGGNITGPGVDGLMSGSTPYEYFVLRQWDGISNQQPSKSNNYGIDTDIDT